MFRHYIDLSVSCSSVCLSAFIEKPEVNISILTALITKLHLEMNNDYHQELTSQIHNGIISRLGRTNGYYKSGFMVRRKPVFSAIDNIDIVIVVWQEEDEKWDKN